MSVLQFPTPASMMKEKLASSGLTEKQGKKLKLVALSAEETKSLATNFHAQAAMKIPYFYPSGQLSAFYRIRYLGEMRTGFEAGAKKQRRYSQPPDTVNEVYFAPLLKDSWKDVLGDTNIPLFITEGELKAAAACARGLPVIGIGGVEMFRAKKQGFPDLLPGLRDINWRKRQVAIIWDSDVGTKPEALSAQQKLAYELSKQGAGIIKLIVLPPEGEHKVGLDDFLLKHTPQDFIELVNETDEYGLNADLWKLNERAVFINSPTCIFRREAQKLCTPKEFELVYANRASPETIKLWFRWPQRLSAESLDFAPGADQMLDHAEGKFWNAWTGWGVESKEGDVKPFLDLVDHIFQGADKGAKEWFLKWCAYQVQNPGEKLFSAVVVWGTEQGTGKTFLGLIIGEIFGKHATKITDEELNASFNDWAADKQFVLGEEITGSDYKDRRHAASRLKDYISGETVQVNPKGFKRYTIPNRINFYFTSNSPTAFFLENKDRRYFVHEVIAGKFPQDKYDKLHEWRKAGGAAHVRYFLERYSTKGFHPRANAFETRAKQDMIMSTKTDVAVWASEFISDPGSKLGALGRTVAAEKSHLITPEQVYRCYNPENDSRFASKNALGRELKIAGIKKLNEGDPITWTKEDKTKVNLRLYIIRNQEEWLKEKDMQKAVAHWVKYWDKEPGY